VELDLAWMKQAAHHHVLSIEDTDYPSQLKEITDPPTILFVQGNKEILSKKQLAMVGARNATPMGLKNAEQFAYYLAGTGLVITSGLALGIDGASHRGALAAKGETIGVAGTGLSHVYPHSHQSLVNDIIQHQGAVISEFPRATSPQPYHFPRRNRIISGLSVGILVVEAALKSGSLITARHAIENNRDVFAIPGSIHNVLAKGCHHLIKQGAKLVETAVDILDELGISGSFSQLKLSDQPKRMSVKVDDTCKRLLGHIECDVTSTDTLISRSGLTAGDVS
jgi:DNA processing protein